MWVNVVILILCSLEEALAKKLYLCVPMTHKLPGPQSAVPSTAAWSIHCCLAYQVIYPTLTKLQNLSLTLDASDYAVLSEDDDDDDDSLNVTDELVN